MWHLNRANWLRGIATSFIYGESLDGRGFAMVSYYDRTTSTLDSTRGALHVPTDTQTFMSPWKVLHGIIGEIYGSLKSLLLVTLLPSNYYPAHTVNLIE